MSKANRSTMFIAAIENIVSTKSMGYLDATLFYSEQTGLEPQVVGNLVLKTPVIKEKIQEEAEAVNLLPKTARLDIEEEEEDDRETDPD